MKPGGDQGVLIAYDCSGSTGSDHYYYGFVKQLVQDNLKASIIAWDDELTVVPREDFVRGHFPQGRGGTDPSVIIPYLAQRDFAGHLILLTDGQVGNGEVDKTDSLITRHNVKFTHVSAHFVKIGGGQFNVAVTAPFTRNCSHDIYHHINGEVSMPAVVRAEDLASLELIETVNTQQEFEQIFESLERAVIARTMRREKDVELHDKLTLMQKRVTASISKAVSADSADATRNLVAALERKDEAASLEAAKEITTQYYFKNEDPFSLNNRMSRLLSFCGGSLRNVANHTDIASNQARSAVVISEAQLPDEPATDFECPITLDVDAPALLIKRGDPVLQAFNEQPKLLDRIINSPLSGITKVVPMIEERLDHPIGSTTYATGRIEESPLTRAPVLDVLVFGNTKACQQYNDRTMAKVLSKQGLKLGNMDLWFAVFLEAIERQPYLSDIHEVAREHMRWRLRTQRSYASLTGLAQYVATKMQLGACCWYCLSSCLVRPTMLGAETDIARVHAEIADPLIKLCQLIDYQVPAAAVKHAERLAGLFALLNACKREGRNGLDGNTILKLAISAIYQNAYEVYPGVFLPVDGPPTLQTVESALRFIYSQTGPFVRKLSLEEIVSFGSKVNPSLSAGSIDLPVNFAPPSVPVYQVAWPQYMGKSVPQVPICPLTCRPYYNVTSMIEGAEVRETWEAAATRLYGGNFFSIKKMYAVLAAKLKRYPTKEELALESYRYYCKEKGLAALPHAVEAQLDEAVASFAGISQSIDIDTFCKRFELSVKRDERQKIEAGVTTVV